jgi:hypothetical protein
MNKDGAVVAFCLGIVGLWLCFWGGVGYVAWHFISKFW